MRSLPKNLDPASAERLLLACEFDGVLCAPEADPAKATILPPTRDALRGLAKLPGVTVAVFSDRSLADLRRRVAWNAAVFAASHGLEIRGKEVEFLDPSAAQTFPQLRRTFRAIQGALRGRRGVSVENRRVTIRVGFPGRKLPGTVRKAIDAAVAEAQGRLRVMPRERSLEILPTGSRTRGDSLRLLYDRLGGGGALVYASAGPTDRSMLQVVAEFQGSWIQVGPGSARAGKRLSGPAEFAGYLQDLRLKRGWLFTLLAGKSSL